MVAGVLALALLALVIYTLCTLPDDPGQAGWDTTWRRTQAQLRAITTTDPTAGSANIRIIPTSITPVPARAADGQPPGTTPDTPAAGPKHRAP